MGPGLVSGSGPNPNPNSTQAARLRAEYDAAAKQATEQAAREAELRRKAADEGQARQP